MTLALLGHNLGGAKKKAGRADALQHRRDGERRGPPGTRTISEALDELGKIEPALAEIVDLKFFSGFSFVEIAAMRDVSERTVQGN